MKPCEHLSHYLDGRLERAGRDYFEEHLGVCSDCQKVVNTWIGTKAGLRKEAVVRVKGLTPTVEEAARLAERAELDRAARWSWWNVRGYYPIAVTACVSFVLAGALVVNVFDTPDESRTDQRPVVTEASILGRMVKYEATLNGNTIGKLGKDSFGLRPSSLISVVSADEKTTRLNLEKGAAAFSVASRSHGRNFVVEAGKFDVKVVGTKFSVDRGADDGVRVSVVEGKVEVEDGNGTVWRIDAGETLFVTNSGKVDRNPATKDETAMVSWMLGESTFPATAAAARAGNADDDAANGELAMVFDTPPDDTIVQQAAPIPADRVGRPAAQGKGTLRTAVGRKPQAELTDLPILEQHEPEETPEAQEVEETAEGKDEDGLELESGLNGVALWRQWVLEGRLTEAEDALHRHLKSHSIDTEAMSLLADCRRKAGKYNDALETYKKLMMIAGEKQANRARFKAGVLMQEQLGNHYGAANLFEEYLASNQGSPLLRAKATVRLARSLVALGEKARAKKLLDQVMRNHGGSSAAIQAREILDGLK